MYLQRITYCIENIPAGLGHLANKQSNLISSNLI